MSLDAAQPSETRETAHYHVQVYEGIPAWLSVESESILKAHGFDYKKLDGRNYSLSGPDDMPTLCAALSALPQGTIDPLEICAEVISDPLKRALKVADDVHRLKFKCIDANPEYPIGNLTGVPYSMPLDATLKARFGELLDALAAQGIMMRMGAELELVLSVGALTHCDDALNQMAHALVKKESDAFNRAVTTEKKRYHAERLLAIREFNARDFVMMHLLESDPLTSGVFEHSFGRRQGGAGYYDNENVFELRTEILSAETFFELYTAAQRRVLEAVYQYRFKISSNLSQQLNVSFWRDGKNILLCETPEDEALTRKIIRGMGWATEEGYSLYFPSEARYNRGSVPVISPSRFSTIRHAHGRLEIKGFHNESQHLIVPAVMAAGVVSAVLDPVMSAEIEKKARPVSRIIVPGLSFASSDAPWLRHVFTACVVDVKKRTLTPDKDYIKMSATKVLAQLNPDDPAFKKEKPAKKSELPQSPKHHQKIVSAIVSLARIFQDKGGWHLQWPKGKLMALSEDTILDTDMLNEYVTCHGISARFQYSVRDIEKPIDVRLQNLQAHPLLNRIFGASLLKKMTDALAVENFTHYDRVRMMVHLIHGFVRAFEDEPEYNEQGLRILRVEMAPLPRALAQSRVKTVLNDIREHKDNVGVIFKDIMLISMHMDQRQENVTGFGFCLPFVSAALEEVREILVHASNHYSTEEIRAKLEHPTFEPTLAD